MGMLTGVMIPGNYDVPNLRFELKGVYTNKTPVGAYRGAGRPEATYLLECLMDAVAHELDLDPAEVRRKNFIAPDQFPHTTAVRHQLRHRRVREGARQGARSLRLRRASARSRSRRAPRAS